MKYFREFCGYPDVIGMAALSLAAGIGGFWLAVTPWVWGALAGGMLLFLVTEYMTHRFVFHMAPPRNPFLRRMLHRLHYDHHERPDELHLLFLPLWFSVPQLAVIAGVLWFLSGNVALGLALAAGSGLMQLLYEWRHFVAHRPITPITSWGRWMKKYHRWHHYKNEHYWYGVTNPSLDVALGTYRDVHLVEKSATARKLDEDL